MHNLEEDSRICHDYTEKLLSTRALCLKYTHSPNTITRILRNGKVSLRSLPEALCIRNRIYKRNQMGSNNNRWLKGIAKAGRGYFQKYCPYHPDAIKNYIPHHRWVMEQHLNRQLLKEETVHHINGEKGDNRIENLKLFSSIAEHNHYEHKRLYFLEKCIQEGKLKFIGKLKCQN